MSVFEYSTYIKPTFPYNRVMFYYSFTNEEGYKEVWDVTLAYTLIKGRYAINQLSNNLRVFL